MDFSTHTHTGLDKVKRYGWTVQDAPGEQRLLHKDLFQIDSAYQRDLIVMKVKEICTAWSWVACGVIVVAERNGRFWVIDGQHRAAAAKRRSDITHLPCLVFKTLDVQQDAQGFLRLNTSRRPVSAIGRQKALVASGDEAAVHVQQQCAALGLEIKVKPKAGGEMKCIGWCLKRAAEDRQRFTDVLTLGAEISRKDDIFVPERVLDGLWYLSLHCGDGLNDKRLVKRLREKGAAVLLKAASSASAYYANGGGKIWAHGMLNELNRGLQERHRFTINGAEA
jgi:hypothetical protein